MNYGLLLCAIAPPAINLVQAMARVDPNLKDDQGRPVDYWRQVAHDMNAGSWVNPKSQVGEGTDELTGALLTEGVLSAAGVAGYGIGRKLASMSAAGKLGRYRNLTPLEKATQKVNLTAAGNFPQSLTLMSGGGGGSSASNDMMSMMMAYNLMQNQSSKTTIQQVPTLSDAQMAAALH